MQRFRGGLVFEAHRLCVSLNSRLASNEEEEQEAGSYNSSRGGSKSNCWAGWFCGHSTAAGNSGPVPKFFPGNNGLSVLAGILACVPGNELTRDVVKIVYQETVQGFGILGRGIFGSADTRPSPGTRAPSQSFSLGLGFRV